MMYNQNGMTGNLRWVPLLVVFVALTGCTGGRIIRYINPDANFSYIKGVAILPFNNFSGDSHAGEKVKGIMTVELLSRGVFDVMEQGEVSKILSVVLRGMGMEEGMAVEFDKETLKLLGERLGVQAVIIGSVDEYGGTGTASLVSLSIRMLDTSSGIVLWQVKSTVSGYSVWRSIVGIEGRDITVFSTKAVENALDTLL